MLDELVRKIADLGSRLYKLETAKQPYLSDWFNINASQVTADPVTNNIISTTDLDLTTIIKAGKKIRFKQTGDTDWKYGISYTITTNGMKISGDTLTHNVNITDFSIATSDNPVGFPSFFSKTVTPVDDTGGSATFTIVSSVQNYNITGNLVKVDILSDFTVATANTTRIKIPLPILASDLTINALPMRIYDYSVSGYVAGLVSGGTQGAVFKKESGANFISGTEYLINYTYFYNLYS